MRGIGLLIFLVLSPLSAISAESGGVDPVSSLEQAWSIRSSQPDQFAQLLTKIDVGRASLNAAQLEELDYLLAYKSAYRSDFERAIPALEALRSPAYSKEIRLRAGTTLVNMYGKTRRFADALRLLVQLSDEVKQVDVDDLKIGVYVEASLVYGLLGKYDESLFNVQQVKSFSLTPRDHCIASYLESEALFELKRSPDGFSEIDRAIGECIATQESVVANLIRTVKARRLAELGRKDEAAALLTTYLNEVEATRSAYLIVEFKVLLAELLSEKGDLNGAEAYATDAVAQSSSLGAASTKSDAYLVLYNIALVRRDLEQALVFYRRYAESDKAYLNEVKTRELAFQMVQHETLQNSQLLKQLGSQNDLLKLQREVEQKSAQNSRLIIVLLILLLGGVGLWAARTRRVHKKLREMAETDALTGVCNRHHFTNQAERSLAMCAGAGEEVALVMFDLDHFKTVNDQYGHAVGDWVLKHVATTSRTFCRRVDTLGRIGGEEFAFLLHGCDLQTAIRLAEDCRARIALIDTIESGYKFTITASFGVASSSVSGYQLTRLLSHADRMLYRAKSLGRNRVCAYDGNTEFDMPAEPLPRTGTVTRIASAHPDAANRNHLSAG